jgi:hypothetical protein
MKATFVTKNENYGNQRETAFGLLRFSYFFILLACGVC